MDTRCLHRNGYTVVSNRRDRCEHRVPNRIAHIRIWEWHSIGVDMRRPEWGRRRPSPAAFGGLHTFRLVHARGGSATARSPPLSRSDGRAARSHPPPDACLAHGNSCRAHRLKIDDVSSLLTCVFEIFRIGRLNIHAGRQFSAADRPNGCAGVSIGSPVRRGISAHPSTPVWRVTLPQSWVRRACALPLANRLPFNRAVGGGRTGSPAPTLNQPAGVTTATARSRGRAAVRLKRPTRRDRDSAHIARGRTFHCIRDSDSYKSVSDSYESLMSSTWRRRGQAITRRQLWSCA
jgi:hypothetical protein